MDRELVSIIIPVYNVEKYIKQCVDSVLEQTWHNLEIWLIDDGSTDSSGNICDQYTDIDKRVRVIHKENGGLSSARNTALDLISGSFVFFLDSDDYIEKNLIESLVLGAKKNSADIAVVGLSIVYDDSQIIDKKEKHEKILTAKDAIKNMLMTEDFGHEACGKLYNVSLFKENRFPVGRLYEDYLTTYRIFVDAKRIFYTDEGRYFYRMRKGSIMKSNITKKELTLIDVVEVVTSYIIDKYSSLLVPAKRLQTVTYMKLLKRILDGGFENFKEEQEFLMDSVMNNYRLLMENNVLKKSDLIKIKSLRIGKNLFYVVYSLGELINYRRQKRIR